MRRFEKVSYDDTGILPTRADTRSAGYDFYTPEEIVLEEGQTRFIKTNIKAYMNQDEVLMIYPRSSIGIKKEMMLANSVGVIDSSYVDNKDNEGNIIIALHHYGRCMEIIKAGERIAQGVFMKYLTTDDDSTTNTIRTGGIGSSGK